MPATVLMRVVNGNLQPMNDRARVALSKIGHAKIVKIEVKQPRNVRFHRKYWKLIDTVYDNVESLAYPDLDDFHDAIKIMVGCRKRLQFPKDIRDPETGEIIARKGTVVFVPGSIAFHNMTEATFEKFFNRVCDLVVTYFWPTVTAEWLRAEIEKLVSSEDKRYRG